MKSLLEIDNYIETLQRPIGSGFGATSTASDVIKGIDLSGKVAIVTGGNAGIGLETTKVFAAAGAKVIVGARDVVKAEKNLHGLENVEVASLDLIDTRSIDTFADKFLASGRPLHLLVNNAGIMWVPLRRDSRGIESQLATNYLGHFQLTARLWSALLRANGARVVNVSSYGHQMAPFNFEDPNFLHREYDTLLGYGQSKTATNLFAVELDRRGKKYNIRGFSLHPGSINGTELGREAPVELFQKMGMVDSDGKIFPDLAAKLKTIAQGAATTVWCATSAQLNNIGGVYCENCDVAEIDLGNINKRYDDPSSQRGVQPYSLNKAFARHLWNLSEEWTGVIFPS